jgi:hypothetical protein
LGIDDNSLVSDKEHLAQKVSAILPGFDCLLVEEYIEGREFTVLVAANADGEGCRSFKPVEYVFPEGASFKTYSLKTSDLHPNCNVPCDDAVLEQELRTAAEGIFKNFNGEGYARLDFRVNHKNEIYFLEINFTCSVFYKDGYEGSADYILKYDGTSQQQFLKLIIEEGISRHERKLRKYKVKGNSIAGFGLYATKDIAAGEVIFQGEGRSQRIISKSYVDQYWDSVDKETFTRYAYPVSPEVYILWDNDPSEWAPQNHSCDPNTGYEGLNVVSLKKINRDEELTLDYSNFLDDSMMPFQCSCGSAKCRGVITGKPGNTPFSSPK